MGQLLSSPGLGLPTYAMPRAGPGSVHPVPPRSRPNTVSGNDGESRPWKGHDLTPFQKPVIQPQNASFPAEVSGGSGCAFTKTRHTKSGISPGRTWQPRTGSHLGLCCSRGHAVPPSADDSSGQRHPSWCQLLGDGTQPAARAGLLGAQQAPERASHSREQGTQGQTAKLSGPRCSVAPVPTPALKVSQAAASIKPLSNPPWNSDGPMPSDGPGWTLGLAQL